VTKIDPSDPPGMKLIVVDEQGRRKEISHYGERLLSDKEAADAVARGKAEQEEMFGGVRMAKENEKRRRGRR
jgi:hypothetical protein